jgi:hypothetical protein
MIENEKKSISLRGFLKAGLYGAGAVGVLSLERKVKKYVEPFFSYTDIDFLDGLKAGSDLPETLCGAGVNVPFLWTRSNDQIKETLDLIVSIGGPEGKSRILTDSDKHKLEPSLGKFDPEVTGMLDNFLKQIPPGMTVIMPILDGYNLFRCNKKNIFYSSKPLDSPYLSDCDTPEAAFKSQMDFFTKDKYKDAYKNRADFLIDTFGKYPNVIFEIGNEIAAPIEGREGIDINTAWYREMYEHIHKKKDIVLTGLADPNQIDLNGFLEKQGLLNTAHIYYPKINNFQKGVPVIIEEIGVPSHIFNRINIPHADELLNGLILFSLYDSVKEGYADIGGILLWHMDLEHKTDNFGVVPALFPKTIDLLTRVSPRLQEIFRKGR